MLDKLRADGRVVAGGPGIAEVGEFIADKTLILSKCGKCKDA